jgi:hypothetical protein
MNIALKVLAIAGLVSSCQQPDCAMPTPPAADYTGVLQLCDCLKGTLTVISKGNFDCYVKGGATKEAMAACQRKQR